MMFPLIVSMALIASGSQTSPPPSTPGARHYIDRVGVCLADGSPEVTARMLSSDFTKTSYRQTLDRVIESNRTCTGKRGFRSSRLLLAGSIAERLIKKDGRPVNVRLAQAASGDGAATFSPSDKVAMCVVRSMPDEVGGLFATEIASADEVAASDRLQPALTLCAGDGPKVQATPEGLRAMLATAAFRSLTAAGLTEN